MANKLAGQCESLRRLNSQEWGIGRAKFELLFSQKARRTYPIRTWITTGSYKPREVIAL